MMLIKLQNSHSIQVFFRCRRSDTVNLVYEIRKSVQPSGFFDELLYDFLEDGSIVLIVQSTLG
jgi:hypothetical protein